MRMRTYIYVCVCKCTYTYNIYPHTYIGTYVRTYAHMHAHMHACTHSRTHACTHARTRAPTHAHTHIIRHSSIHTLHLFNTFHSTMNQQFLLSLLHIHYSHLSTSTSHSLSHINNKQHHVGVRGKPRIYTDSFLQGKSYN